MLYRTARHVFSPTRFSRSIRTSSASIISLNESVPHVNFLLFSRTPQIQIVTKSRAPSTDRLKSEYKANTITQYRLSKNSFLTEKQATVGCFDVAYRNYLSRRKLGKNVQTEPTNPPARKKPRAHASSWRSQHRLQRQPSRISIRRSRPFCWANNQQLPAVQQ